MIKVFESFDFAEAGRVRSLLETHGIETYMQNEFSAFSGLPFDDGNIRLFVVHEGDLVQATSLIAGDGP